MKLTEISAFKGGANETFTAALDKFIAKHGVKAFHGTNAVVIDRGSFVWRAWFNDPGYERFIEYAQAHKGNVHLPKILSSLRTESVRFKSMPSGMTIKFIKLEKLKEADPSNLTDAIDALSMTNTQRLPTTVADLSTFMLSLKAPSHSDAAPEDLQSAVTDNADFFKTVLDLFNHQANDLNSGNVMMRGSTPVITDPFSGKN